MTNKRLKQLDEELNEMITDGRILEAFDRFYADDVVMQENLDTPVRGKTENRKREQEFLDRIERINETEILSTGIGDDVTYAELSLDAKLKNGDRMQLTEIARREWKDGKIVHERFYYPSGPRSA